MLFDLPGAARLPSIINQTMITYEQALDIIAATARPLAASTVPLAAAAGCTAASAVNSPGAVPPFNNSAMDGFAVRAADVGSASEQSPAELRVLGLVRAGDAAAADRAEPGTAWEIMTGAPVPAGFDGVIPVEQVDVVREDSGRPARIRLRQSVAPGRNLRRAGEDFNAGDCLVSAGQRIGPSQIMGLAATGVSEVQVRKPARIAAITTGNELTTSGQALRPGKIHDSNGPYLGAAIPALGADCVGVHRTSDSADELIARIDALGPTTDVILTTGGVSAGRMDFVPVALEQMGADILFHRVAIRPGKPVLFARLPDGRLVFGLPGNPIAVAVGLRFFVAAALRTLTGMPAEQFATALLDADHHKKPGLTFFAKAALRRDAAGVARVSILPGQESFKIQPLLQANCWVIGAAASEALEAHTPVSVAPL